MWSLFCHGSYFFNCACIFLFIPACLAKKTSSSPPHPKSPFSPKEDPVCFLFFTISISHLSSPLQPSGQGLIINASFFHASPVGALPFPPAGSPCHPPRQDCFFPLPPPKHEYLDIQALHQGRHYRVDLPLIPPLPTGVVPWKPG